MSYPENYELENNNSWNDEELNDNELGNNSINNDSIDYNWSENDSELESYNWNTEGVEYFDDFNWNPEKEYFDDFNWSENNEQDENKDRNQDNTYEEEPWDEDNIQETNWDENIQDIENIEDIQDIEDIQYIEDIQDSDNDIIHNKTNRLQGIPNPIGSQGLLGQEFIKELCIKPMYHILKQLKELVADDVEIGIEKQGTILDCMIVKLDEYIVVVRNSFREITIPIHQIVGIYSRRLPQVSLFTETNNNNNNNNNKTGDYDCYERPLREYCSNHIGEDYTINTIARDEIFSSLKGSITKVGEGILILSNTVAILICKIISIEKDARSTIRNYDKNEK